MGRANRTLRIRSRDDAGAELVEFALVVPVLLIIVLGIINFGYLFGQKLALNQAVREGARQAVVPGTNSGASVDEFTEIEAVVKGSLGGLVPPAGVTVSPMKGDGTNTSTPTGCNEIPVGVPLKIEATFANAKLLVPLPVPGVPATFNLKSQAIFRCEW